MHLQIGNENGWCDDSKMVWIRKKVKLEKNPCFDGIKFLFSFRGIWITIRTWMAQTLINGPKMHLEAYLLEA